MNNSKPKKFKRFIIGDPKDKSPEYLDSVKDLEKKGTGVLHLSGVQGNQPEFLTQKELLSSFKNLKIHYGMRELEYRRALEELEKIHSAQFGNKGLLKRFGMEDLHPLYFYRLIALRFQELSKANLESLTSRNADKKNYVVKNLSKRKFQQHFKDAISDSKWVDLPVWRAKNNLFALKVMAIGVIEDYLDRALEPHEREDLIAESGPFLKKLQQGLIQFTNDGVGYATKFEKPRLPGQGRTKKPLTK